jgi:Predicted membrane protein
MVLFRKLVFGNVGYKFLVWNLFLAWIPLLFSIVIGYVYAFHKRNIFRKLYLSILGVIWVIFYPNSPYTVTDFIHISGLSYYFNDIGYRMNFIIWYDFIMIALFILTGFLLGFISLYMIQMLLVDRFNKFFSWLFVCFILMLSSFGIYLGRFIRWNSWDILFNPKVLIHSILDNSKHYAAEFTISFGLFLILIYFALYYLTNLNEYRLAFHRQKNK